MRKATIAATLSIIMLGTAGTAAFAAHTDNPAAEAMTNMEGMTNMDGTAMPMMQGMMAMMQGMMPMMMGMMPMMMSKGAQPMAGMADPAAAPQAVPAGLEQKLDLLISSIDSLTARIEKLEAPAAN